MHKGKRKVIARGIVHKYLAVAGTSSTIIIVEK